MNEEKPKVKKTLTKHELIARSNVNERVEVVLRETEDELEVMYIKRLSAGELCRLQQRMVAMCKKAPERDLTPNMQQHLLAECVVDERGSKVFKSHEEVGEMALNSDLAKLVEKAVELNPYDQMDLRRIGKNSEAASDLTSIE